MSGAAGNLRPSGQRGRQKAEMFAGHPVAVDASVSGETVVGAGVAARAGATMFGKVPFDFAAAGEDAVVRDSILRRTAVAAPGAMLGQAVGGDGAFIWPGNELACGIRVSPTRGSSRLPPSLLPVCGGQR